MATSGTDGGTGHPDLTGYNVVNSVGVAGSNTHGTTGSDAMIGSDVADDLRASDGDDYLIDGAGVDKLRGDAGADYFELLPMVKLIGSCITNMALT